MSSSAVDRIIDAAMEPRVMNGARLPLAETWPATSYGLDRCTLFVTAVPERKREVLEHCARARLQEAWHIERLGITYGAKMTLHAESDDERTLYGLICGEEAAHFRMIASLVEAPAAASEFTALLDRIVAAASKPALVCLVQVVLEGWGMHYYARLERECVDPVVQEAFASILRDEARHHGSGVALSRGVTHDPATLAEIEGYLRELLAMVRSGPQSIAAALAPAGGAEARGLFVELGDGKTRADLQLLRKLLDSPPLRTLVANLDRDAMFDPMTPDEMARVHCPA